jgi:hypothetical protein
MEEFIFGTLATDELKLMNHRAVRQGLQHNHDLSPRSPKPGQPVTISVTVGADFDADMMACYFTTDGSEPAGAYGAAVNGGAVPFEREAVSWDTATWGYLTRWNATLPGQPDGTMVRYRISAWTHGAASGTETFADWPESKTIIELSADAFFRGVPPPEWNFSAGIGRTFAYHVDTHRPPGWARNAIIYQVFVDRFYPGEGRNWLQTDDLNGICGGTLWGVAEKLDYIADLGANCIWLSPIFTSPTHHGYDTTDFYEIDPRYGGEAALRAVIDGAHARGLRVLLDLVCNHVSNHHPIFRDALHNRASPYRDYFTFDESPLGYRAFFANPSMPEINVQHPPAREWLLEVTRHYLRQFHVDGYRLDYANGPGPDFWADFRAACKAENPDCYIFGEVVDAPDVQRKYAGRLDGCLDFHLGDALRRTYGLKRWQEADFQRFVGRHQAFFDPDFVMPSFLDNHDMDRFLFVAGGDKDALRAAAAVQMALPNPPIIYYGTEIGLSQAVSTRDGMGLHISRTPMVWGRDQDAALLADYKALIAARKAR